MGVKGVNVFSSTAYLVTLLDLVTVFGQTKCVTKSGLHCTFDFAKNPPACFIGIDAPLAGMG